MNEFSEHDKKIEDVEVPSDLQNGAPQEAEEAFTTIFSDPTAHNDKAKTNGNKSRLKKIIAAIVAVAILVGGTITVIKLIPEKTEENKTPSGIKEISVLSLDSNKFSSVTVTNKKGIFKLYSQQVKTETDAEGEKESDTKTEWCVEGTDSSLTSSTSISYIASKAASITASRKIDTKTPVECGLETPTYKIDVAYADGNGDYSVLIGDASPDKTGTYLKLSNDDSIYIVDDMYTSSFDFELLDLADSSYFAPSSFKVNLSNYVDGNGALKTFDSITLSGNNFPQVVTIRPNNDKDLSSVISYVIETPAKRYADNADVVLSPFANGITVVGAYSFDVSADTLAKFGLDKPDVVLTIDILGEEKTFKFSKVDDDYCAVINEDSKIVKKVSISTVPFVNYSAEDLYAPYVSMEVISNLSNFTLSTGGTDYSFDIQYNPDGEEYNDKYTITHNGKKLTATNFQGFYGFFVGIKASDFSTTKLDASPDATVTLTFLKDGSKRVIEFRKFTETKYQYSINGVDMGKISATYYNKLIKNVKLVSENKAVR